MGNCIQDEKNKKASSHASDERKDEIDDLKNKSVRGGVVTMFSQAITIGIQLASTVVLARLLSPEDYGILAMVIVVTTFAGLFRDMGLASAAIQSKEITHSQQSNLFWLNILMGAFLTIAVATISPLVAAFYGKPELTAVTCALSVSFLIGSIGTQHGAMLIRQMRFGLRAVATNSGALVAFVVSIILAIQGFSYWSLIWGNLVGGLCTTLVFVFLSPFHPRLPSKNAGIREMLGFGLNVTAFDMVNYLSRNLDNILIGRFWGAEGLGYYSRAYALLMLPINAIRSPIMAVAFPAMSRLQADFEAYRSYYCRIIMLLSNLTMPLVAFLFVGSTPIVRIVLGEKWLAASSIFSVLAVTAFIQCPFSITGLVPLSQGRSKRYLKIGVVSAAITSLGFCVGVYWGALGVAIAYAITTYVRLIPILLWSYKDSPLRIMDFFSNMYSSTIACIVAISITYITSLFFVDMKAFALLISMAGIFGITYLMCLLCIPRARADVAWCYSIVRSKYRCR